MFAVTTVDDYITAQAAEAQLRLRELRAGVRGAAPNATEIIRYGMLTFKHGGRSVHFGVAKRHCALYGVPTDLFANELRDFKTLKAPSSSCSTNPSQMNWCASW